MIAIILAGGRSSRFGGVEKPLLEIGDMNLIDYVINAVRNSAIKEFVVAVSKNTPKTTEYCKLQGFNIIHTPGKGYHEDIKALLEHYPVFVSVASDIPFLTSWIIDALLKTYKGYSIIGAIPLSLVHKSIKPSYVFKYRNELLMAIGINVVTKSKKSKIKKFRDPLLAININTPQELDFARKIFSCKQDDKLRTR